MFLWFSDEFRFVCLSLSAPACIFSDDRNQRLQQIKEVRRNVERGVQEGYPGAPDMPICLACVNLVYHPRSIVWFLIISDLTSELS